MANQQVTDMTVGSPLRHILQFALPLLLGNLFQQIYNMVDSLIVGKFVGHNALGAVGACGSLNFLFFSLSSGIAIGIGVIVSQYFGAQDNENVRVTIGNAIYVLLITSVIVTVLAFSLTPFLIKLLKTPIEIQKDAILYLRTTALGIIAIALYNGVASILRALGDSKTPLLFLILSTIINVILDIVFVLVLKWGVFGVAFATVISQCICVVTATCYAYHHVSYFKLTKKQLKPRKEIILRAYRIGIPVALQSSMIAISCMVLQGVVNTFGTTVVTAYSIIGRIEMIVQQPYGSLGMALTTFAGQNMGANQKERVKQGYKQGVMIALIFSLAMIPIAYLFGSHIIGFFLDKGEGGEVAQIIAIGTRALKITSLCYFALGMIYIPRAILNGCGDTGFSMINGITEVICRIGYSQIFIRIPQLSYWGIWITTIATWITTAIVCVIRYRSGIWQRKAVVKENGPIDKNDTISEEVL